MSRNLTKAVKTGIIVNMKITGAIFVIMVALLNVLPFAALAANNPADAPMIECHCDEMRSMQPKGSYSQKQKKSYFIDCSSSDKQTQESQNHSRVMIVSESQLSNPTTSSYIYPEADCFAIVVYLSTETPPPKYLV